ncbi:hypothetical protein FPV67DRAFT_233003 [Lyophyllum atratum]|nr:hypothetical protein FPV67DRAFT_233003 [Lyophyllum atratum]
MKFSSAILFTLPVVLASWTAVAEPTVAGRDIAQLTRNNLVARHAAEWDVYRRDFEPETLNARRACRTTRDCLGQICMGGTCK